MRKGEKEDQPKASSEATKNQRDEPVSGGIREG
jgi:hypothetical protein